MSTNTSSLSTFAASLGFEENPFQYTNANLEERLPDYFVPPPYFASVLGDPSKPETFRCLRASWRWQVRTTKNDGDSM